MWLKSIWVHVTKIFILQVILLTNSYSKTDQRGTTDVIADGKFDVTYRSLLLSYTPDEEVLESLANEIMKTFIIQRIADYSTEVKASIECRKILSVNHGEF